MTEREALEEAVRLYDSYGLLAGQNVTDRLAVWRWINGARDAVAAPPAVGGEARAAVLAALRECASRCRYDGDLFCDQGNEWRRDASWKAAGMAEAAIDLLAALPASLRENADRAHDALYGLTPASPGRVTDEMVNMACEVYAEVYHDDDKDMGDAMRAALKAVSEQPASPLRGRDYSAWLIEVSEPEGPEYFQLVDDDNWSSDHDTALHFARKQDAEKYIADVGWTRARAVEHMWPAAPPEQPADPLSDLVSGFAKALLAKLRLASANGRSGWERDDWEKQCQQGLLRHLAKGDPRDVAAYCAFMWHHDWITAAPEQPAAGWKLVPKRATDAQMDAGLNQASHDATWADVFSVYADMIDAAPSIDDHPDKAKPALPEQPAADPRQQKNEREMAEGSRCDGSCNDGAPCHCRPAAAPVTPTNPRQALIDEAKSSSGEPISEDNYMSNDLDIEPIGGEAKA